jgi:ADP-heptose:LPS heptosyltransferase
MVFPRRLREWPGFLREIHRIGFTHVLDFDNTEKTTLVTQASRASQTVVFSHEPVSHRSRWFYLHVATVKDAGYNHQHITDTYHALLPPIGVLIRTHDIRLVPRPEDVATTAKLVGQSPRKILIHPGSRSSYRVWPAERFAAICDRLQDRLGTQVFIAAGPGELAMAKAIQEKAQSHVVVLESSFSIPQFAALLSHFDVVLCHDSGPMHLAAAVGTSVVALYSSQNATIWRPVGEGHIVLQTTLPCSCLPESERPGPCTPANSYLSYCVRKLDVDTVFAALVDKLQSKTSQV